MTGIELRPKDIVVKELATGTSSTKKGIKAVTDFGNVFWMLSKKRMLEYIQTVTKNSCLPFTKGLLKMWMIPIDLLNTLVVSVRPMDICKIYTVIIMKRERYRLICDTSHVIHNIYNDVSFLFF